MARVLIAEWERVEGPVTASYVANFADMARAALAAAPYMGQDTADEAAFQHRLRVEAEAEVERLRAIIHHGDREAYDDAERADNERDAAVDRAVVAERERDELRTEVDIKTAIIGQAARQLAERDATIAAVRELADEWALPGAFHPEAPYRMSEQLRAALDGDGAK